MKWIIGIVCGLLLWVSGFVYAYAVEPPPDMITVQQASDYILEARNSHKYYDTTWDRMWVSRYTEILKLLYWQDREIKELQEKQNDEDGAEETVTQETHEE